LTATTLEAVLTTRTTYLDTKNPPCEISVWWVFVTTYIPTGTIANYSSFHNALLLRSSII
ncbi:hypothetical protein N9W79_02565, partial [bacterium]|nr:hypothetical protein [bacterium]